MQSEDLIEQSLRERVELEISAAVAREGLRRADLIAADLAVDAGLPRSLRLRPPIRTAYPRWGWRRALRYAVERRMFGPTYRGVFRRYAWQRLRNPQL